MEWALHRAFRSMAVTSFTFSRRLFCTAHMRAVSPLLSCTAASGYCFEGEDDAEEKFVAEGGLAGGGGPEDMRRGVRRPCEEEEEEEKVEEEEAAAAEP